MILKRTSCIIKSDLILVVPNVNNDIDILYYSLMCLVLQIVETS